MPYIPANVCGSGNTASGTAAATVGGTNNTASADNSATVGGVNAFASLYAQTARERQFYGGRRCATSELVMRRRITGTSQTELFLDATATQAILPATNRVWNFRVDVVGVCDTAGQQVGITAGEVWASWHCGVIKRISTTHLYCRNCAEYCHSAGGYRHEQFGSYNRCRRQHRSLARSDHPPTTAGTTTVCRWVATIHLSEIGY